MPAWRGICFGRTCVPIENCAMVEHMFSSRQKEEKLVRGGVACYRSRYTQSAYVVDGVVETQLHPHHLGVAVPRNRLEVAGPYSLPVHSPRYVHLFASK